MYEIKHATIKSTNHIRHHFILMIITHSDDLIISISILYYKLNALKSHHNVENAPLNALKRMKILIGSRFQLEQTLYQRVYFVLIIYSYWHAINKRKCLHPVRLDYLHMQNLTCSNKWLQLPSTAKRNEKKVRWTHYSCFCKQIQFIIIYFFCCIPSLLHMLRRFFFSSFSLVCSCRQKKEIFAYFTFWTFIWV